jgi:hypothetical protein
MIFLIYIKNLNPKLNYLKSYKIFESNASELEIIKDDISDILLDMSDLSRIGFRIDFQNDLYFVHFYKKDPKFNNGFSIKEISEYLLRIKRYLGDKYNKLEIRYLGELTRLEIKLSDDVHFGQFLISEVWLYFDI